MRFICFTRDAHTKLVSILYRVQSSFWPFLLKLSKTFSNPSSSRKTQSTDTCVCTYTFCDVEIRSLQDQYRLSLFFMLQNSRQPFRIPPLRAKHNRPTHACRSHCFAEEEGFEPSKGFPPYTISSRAPSTNSATLPFLQSCYGHTFKVNDMVSLSSISSRFRTAAFSGSR